MRRVSCMSLHWCHCCYMTAAAKPGQPVGGGTPDCCVCECMFEEGGATWAAAVATCAQVFMCVVGLVGVTALRSHVAWRLRWHSYLDNSAAKVVGLPLGLIVVAARGALMDLNVRISLGTLRIGACRCMECVICLLSLVWGMWLLGGACTLGTCCMLWMSSGVVVSSNLWGFACTWTCVALICCKTCAALEFLALLVIPWMALTHSASAFITLSACVMEGLVMRLCWSWTVLNSCLLLLYLMWQLCVQQCSGNVKIYQLSTEWYAHVLHLLVFLCTLASHPIGASGILLYLKGLLRCAYSKMIEVALDCWIRLIVILVCGSSQSQRFGGKSSATLTKMLRK